jgi:hypothetical protein
MARRKQPMTRVRNIEPSPLTITLVTPGTTAPGVQQTSYVDLSQIASIVARRFYRQGLNWGVGGFKFVSSQPGTIGISKIPNTWVASAAWHKTFALWNKQMNETLEDGGNQSLRARFSDFKIYADVEHRALGFGANLLPLAGLPAVAATPGEWDSSHVVLPQTAADGSGTLIDPTEFTLHMVGASTGASKGIIEGYADSRSYPQSPDPVGPAASSPNNWMSSMFDDGSANPEILDNAENENDELPYPQANYPGGGIQLASLEIHDNAQIYGTSATTNIGLTTCKGGNFPCGLIRLDWVPSADNTTSASLGILINMIPGSHRGYLAERMQDM